LSAVALLLIGPLRFAFAEVPLASFVGAFFLFMVPGVLLSHWFLAEHVSGPAMVPVSFALSVGIFGLLGVPFLMLHKSLELYLWFAGAVVGAYLVAAVLRMLGRKHCAETRAPTGSSLIWLWVPLLLLNAALASVSRMRVPFPYDDIWIYLAWVREFLNADELALHDPYFGNEVGASRAQINGWLLEQAALSKVSGIDLVELVLRYLAPTLVVMSLLAFYALARVLLKSETAALLVGAVYALGFLIHLAPKGSLVGRIAEDKFIAWFLFLPVVLIFAVLFLESRKQRYLMIFAFLCWSVVAVHPVGLAIISLSTAGLGLLHLAVNWRKKEAWIRTVSVGAALLSVLVAPVLYLLATGDSLVAVLKSADISSGDPDVVANMVFVRSGWERVLELGDNYYMVHPSQLWTPSILVAFSVGLLFLSWRLKSTLAAQLLLGMMLLPTIVCFVPPIATFFGNHIVLPGQLWRLTWPIRLAALLTIGWIVWEATRRAELGLTGLGVASRVTRLVPVALLITMMAVAAPVSVDEAKVVYRAVKGPQSSGGCFDPIFPWMRDNINKPSVVLAPDMENTCIPAYSAQANVVSLRGGRLLWILPALERRAPDQIAMPQGALDVRRFFFRSTLEEKVRILQRYDVDYAMLPADSPLNGTLKRQPGFTTITTPGERYSLYAVDRQRLGE
jgi:hypothetical protein